MARFVTPGGVLFAVALIMLIACGQNLDAGRMATAVVSAIGSFICFVASFVIWEGKRP